MLQSSVNHDFSGNKYYDKLVWYDEVMTKAIKAKDENCCRFFKLLALCHTVMPEHKDGTLYLWDFLEPCR